MARSAPGSSTRMPPATLTKTSAADSGMPPCRVSTARTRASRLRSTPVGLRLAHEAGRRIDDLDQAALPHLEDTDLAGGAEPVLESAQGPEGALALALELQHAVDQVLERPRSRQRALLRHVPDQEQRDIESLRRLQQGGGRLTHRADAARGRIRDREGLHRVDHTGGGPFRLERREDALQRGLAQHRYRQCRLSEALRAAA